jgi:hypothetical protein
LNTLSSLFLLSAERFALHLRAELFDITTGAREYVVEVARGETGKLAGKRNNLTNAANSRAADIAQGRGFALGQL